MQNRIYKIPSFLFAMKFPYLIIPIAPCPFMHGVKEVESTYESGSVQQHFINHPALLNNNSCFTKSECNLTSPPLIRRDD
jgi:hypothetical protein